MSLAPVQPCVWTQLRRDRLVPSVRCHRSPAWQADKWTDLPRFPSSFAGATCQAQLVPPRKVMSSQDRPTNLGRIWPTWRQVWSSLGQVGSSSAPRVVAFGLEVSQISASLPNSAPIRTEIGANHRDVVDVGPSSAGNGAKLTDVGPNLAEPKPNLADPEPMDNVPPHCSTELPEGVLHSMARSVCRRLMAETTLRPHVA